MDADDSFHQVERHVIRQHSRMNEDRLELIARGPHRDSVTTLSIPRLTVAMETDGGERVRGGEDRNAH